MEPGIVPESDNPNQVPETKASVLLAGPPGWPPAPPGTGTPPPPPPFSTPDGEPHPPRGNALADALIERIVDLSAIEAAIACAELFPDDHLLEEAADSAEQARGNLQTSLRSLAGEVLISDLRAWGLDRGAFRARLAHLALRGERSEALADGLRVELENSPFDPDFEPPSVYHYPLPEERLRELLNRPITTFVQAVLRDLTERLDEPTATESVAFGNWQRSYYALIYCAIVAPLHTIRNA
jgi:hypothetical protein